MQGSYIYLRTLEHRLQMVEDEQTHSVPRSDEGVARIACFLGYADADGFRAGLTQVLETVQDHYARLFERETELTDALGNLVFTGVEDDPETLETLNAMGFKDAAHIAGAIRGWHHGRIRAMRSQRARELLTKLTPAILKALAAAADPDAAFAQFDTFLSHLPSGGAAVFAVPGAAGISGSAGQDCRRRAAPGQPSGARARHPGRVAGS